ncbi:MAG: AAA family ATPase [Crenarchaeota archaeon]|nr:AAA family ATPase [Thermoproteota archaeon]
MHLTRIEISNFKSIGGRQVVNLSRGLTVLTGRNGSGKCVAPWTIIEQPWGGLAVESFFKKASSEGIRIKLADGEYVIPLEREPLISYYTLLGRSVEASVSAIFRKPYKGWMLKVETANGRKIEVTPEHRLMLADRKGAYKWVEASQLSEGMKIMVIDGGKASLDVLNRIVRNIWRGEVYDIYVENIGSYVTGDGLVVHNSNLIDAIRFALGENNPRLLRIDRLSSLVNDNAGKEAETYVKITIDNSDLTIPGQEKLITVSRRMGRDGESTYYLNGRRTSKNVVEETISSTGLSARGYNIIPQGEISRLADKNPVERRKEIEQALGLAQYDERKAEAISNLQQADNNLRVAQARLQEIDRRMLQLERERNILLRRRMLEKEVEKMQMIINSFEYWRLTRKLEEISRSLEENIALQNKLEAEIASRQAEKKSLIERMEELLETAASATPDAERIRLQYELKDFEKRLGEAFEKLERNRSELNTIKRELSKTRRKRSKRIRKTTRLAKDYRRMVEKHSSINTRILCLLNEKKRLQEVEKQQEAVVSSMMNRLILINRDLDRLMLEEESSERMLREVITYYDNLKRKIGSLSIRRKRETVRKSRIIEKLADLDRVLAERRKMLDEIMNTVTILMGSLDSFRIIFAKASGIADYAIQDERRRRVLDLVKNVSEKKSLSIYGILRENLWFPRELSRAVESLAGDWMDAVLVKSTLDMLFLINFLGGKGIGIKVLTSEGEVNKKEIPLELSKRGKHVMDVVKYPKSIEKHVLKLFWNSIVVNTTEDALVFARRGFRAATINGEVFTVEGGLVRENIEEKIESIRRVVKSFSEKASELSRILETMNSHVRPVLNSKIVEAASIRSRLAEDLNTIDSRMEELGEQLDTLTSEYLEASRRLSQIFKKQDTGKKRLLEMERTRLKSLIAAREKNITRIRKRIKLIENELSMLEKKREFLKNRLVLIENIISNLHRKVAEYRNTEKTFSEKIAKIREDSREVLSLTRDLKAQIENLKGKMRGNIEVVSEGVEDKRRNLVSTIRKLDEEIEVLNAEINRVKDIERKLLVDKEMNENRIQELKNRIPGQPLKVSEDKESLTEEYLNILRSELEKVQEVNMLAINQYEQEVYFYRNALERINELEEERRSIQEFMEDIERRKREAFLDGLNRINKYFSNFFNKMTGGDGWLQLEDPERPFEAGLTVYVRFPGKEARIISGVSGGEKSVAALCLIFAMQKLFPAAFYIFDEPDAHLDYVNIERMTELLKEVSKECQIIIVSLRDVVVSKADKVIGVYVKNGFSRFIEMPVEKALEETTVVG